MLPKMIADYLETPSGRSMMQGGMRTFRWSIERQMICSSSNVPCRPDCKDAPGTMTFVDGVRHVSRSMTVEEKIDWCLTHRGYNSISTRIASNDAGCSEAEALVYLNKLRREGRVVIVPRIGGSRWKWKASR